MKIYGILTALILSATMFTSCDLDYAPENQLVDEKVYKNERTSEAALMGCYVRLNVLLSGAPQDQNNYSNAGYSLIFGDLGTDNLSPRTSVADYVAMDKGEYSTAQHDGLLYNLWHWGYNAIDYANNVIDGINRYGQYDSKAMDRHIAEAKFIRAYSYLQLLCLFGDQALAGNSQADGLIMRLEPYNGYNPDDIQSRVSNAEVWQQIITDIEEAVPALPAAMEAAPQRIRANQAAAKALLSRVYLYRGTYGNVTADLEKARDLAHEVITTSGVQFPSSPTEFATALFPSNEYSQSTGYPDPTTRSEELIFFEPARISTDNYPNGLSFYRKNTCFIPQTALSLYDPKDIRRTELIWQGSKTDNANDLTTKKYSADSYSDVIYIRTAEMKLTYAETVARTQGVNAAAIKELNDVHQRAFASGEKPSLYTSADFSSTDDFIKAVLLERKRELAYEGHTRWDIIRTDNMVNDGKMASVATNRRNMPVPDYEIRISYGAIKQNSGFNN